MSDKQIDVDVQLSEVLLRLRETGAFAHALKEIADAKAGGKEIRNVNLIVKGGGAGELSDEDLGAVVGGAGTAYKQQAEKIPYDALKIPPPSPLQVGSSDAKIGSVMSW